MAHIEVSDIGKHSTRAANFHIDGFRTSEFTSNSISSAQMTPKNNVPHLVYRVVDAHPPPQHSPQAPHSRPPAPLTPRVLITHHLEPSSNQSSHRQRTTIEERNADSLARSRSAEPSLSPCMFVDTAF